MQVTPTRTVALVPLALVALLFESPGLAVAQPIAPVPSLAGAESFVVLADNAVSDVNASTFGGDLGVGPGGTIAGVLPAEFAAGSTLHAGDAVAAQALHGASAVYANLAARSCLPADTNPVLDGASLPTGQYCFDADATLTTTLTLTGAGPWIFLVDGALTFAPGSAVVAPVVAPATCGGSPVYWQVGDASPASAATPVDVGAGAAVVGNILAEGAITLTATATLGGRAISLGNADGTEGGSVTLGGNAVAACSGGQALPTHSAFKVTGGGGINVPTGAAITDPDATGTGFANYGFNGQPGATPGAAAGHFNYVNHVVAANRHVNGPVTDVDVVALNEDGTPRTARLSGTCDGFLPACTFSVLSEDNGEPGVNDRFGVTIVSNGAVVEARSLRVVRNGNIQFHSASLTTDVNAPMLHVGQTMRVTGRLRKDKTRTAVDAYLVLQLPGGQLLSWTGGGFTPGLAPLVRNFVPVDIDVEIVALPIPAGAPPGVYRWLSALTQAGTMNLLTGIAERQVVVTP